jgi:hypothetical protein
MSDRKPLSSYPTSQSWLSRFDPDDRKAAMAMLDSMLLLNEEQVSSAIRSQLYRIADSRHGKRKRIALYAEREFCGMPAFEIHDIPYDRGRIRRRAVGRKGPAPVKPMRGSGRVGSEGLVAFVISQAHETKPRSFMNHPGPDLIRGKTNPAGSIAVVTDFIGSGSRVRAMLDAFWAVPTVRSWVSRKLVDFKVIAAAATAYGANAVGRHRVRPEVSFQHVAPTVVDRPTQQGEWLRLIEKYGPESGRGTGRQGFGNSLALIAFNYRIPNNTPSLIHQSRGQWKALYEGAAPEDLRPVFGLWTPAELVDRAAADTGVAIARDLPVKDAALVIILSLLRGRLRSGTEIELAERTGMSVPDVLDLLARAKKEHLFDTNGHLTELGQRLLADGRRSKRKRPLVTTNPEPYYPMALRVPRDSFSTRRPSGRP